ncbi:MAG: hypothetical protein AB1489_19540 [Acidobacteriota bacterium]
MRRLNEPVEVILGLLDIDGNIVGLERTITDLIAENGVSVLTARRINIGEKLHFKTADRQFESSVIVKDVRIGKENQFRLMLEFIGQDWKQQWGYWAQFTDLETVAVDQDELIEAAKEVSLLLRIIISDASNGQPVDQIFLNDLQTGIDNLRELIFRFKKV